MHRPLDWHVTNADGEEAAKAAPEATAAPVEATAEPKEPPERKRSLWPWIAVAFVGVIALGALIGAALGTRQSPLASQGTAGARPTIVLATPAPPPVSIAASPSPSAAAPAPGVASPSSGATMYEVQPGDTLRSIAEQQYGDATLWPRVYDANRDVIGPDPDALRAGMQLRLPAQ